MFCFRRMTKLYSYLATIKRKKTKGNRTHGIEICAQKWTWFKYKHKTKVKTKSWNIQTLLQINRTNFTFFKIFVPIYYYILRRYVMAFSFLGFFFGGGRGLVKVSVYSKSTHNKVRIMTYSNAARPSEN